MAWRWILGGVVAIGVGLTLWWTAFILVPAGVVLMAVGVVTLIRGRLHRIRVREAGGSE